MRQRHLALCMIWLISVTMIIAGCQGQAIGVQTIPPSISTPVSTPTPQALPTQAGQGQILTPTPFGFAVGSVLADQTLALDVAQPGSQEIVFEGKAEAAIKVQAVRQNSDNDFRLSLIDKYGTTIAEIDSVLGSISELISEFTLPYDGSYRLNITPTAGAGTVQIIVIVIESPTGGGDFELLPIESGGTIALAGTYHLYKFHLDEGETISAAAATDADSPMDLALTVIGPDGRGVSSGSATMTGFVAPATGMYQAIVSNPQGGAGDYTFHVSSDTVLPTPTGAADISYDQEYRAAFADKSVLSLTFDGTVGDILSIEITDPDRGLDIDVYVFSPYDHIVAFAVEGPLNEMQLPYTGRYRLELRPRGSGEAVFAIRRLPSEQLSGGGVFGESIRETRSSHFNEPNVFHYYQFTGAPHDVVSVNIERSDGSDLKLVIALLGPSGQEIQFVESGNELVFGFSSVELRQSGTYTIIVYSLNATEGLYDLTFERE